ncbi:MAG: hypothetical protein N2035_09845 [Chthoniobacterales bacterium]|nr:hypothetical protein [Chthoniobacterales bacterium]
MPATHSVATSLSLLLDLCPSFVTSYLSPPNPPHSNVNLPLKLVTCLRNLKQRILLPNFFEFLRRPNFFPSIPSPALYHLIQSKFPLLSLSDFTYPLCLYP